MFYAVTAQSRWNDGGIPSDSNPPAPHLFYSSHQIVLTCQLKCDLPSPLWVIGGGNHQVAGLRLMRGNQSIYPSNGCTTGLDW